MRRPTSLRAQGYTSLPPEKAHVFRKADLLDVLHHEMLSVIQEFGWLVEAWAVFSNHYHFVAHSPVSAEDASSLSSMLYQLHRRTAIIANQHDNTLNRRVWHNFWETKLSYQSSYLARLNYVHQNPVKHRLAPVANHYR